MKIASFNVRRFGVKKCTDPKVSLIINKIVSRYDIIVILEVFDAKEKAAKKLVEQLNSGDGPRYNYVLSKPLGRNDYKEQYLFVFRDFVLIPIHTTPKDSVQEIDELYDVYLTVKEKWDTEKIIFLGDFNADGAYVSNKKMKTIRLRKDPDLHWLIDDDVDTTAVKTTDFSYDRIVVHNSILKHIVPNSAKPFNFQDEYKLPDEEVLAVSDHYPVEVEICLAKKQNLKKKMKTEK
ncbi:hypothetical protein GDO86_007206 [Hymenochirus boettgeri]|uniref:Endonuclease/exonuclease/phosphatase domain-containing protein n=1 Tax=Hymenochirus boettgeri TaxID=247094 RepID=A0A8T2IYA7_9PIPI|nr:hypothetical protein GDO86_007206 [Hymenochirus boettgeri]